MDPNALLLALLTGGGLVKVLDIAQNNRPKMRALKRDNQQLQSKIDDWEDWYSKFREWVRVNDIDISDIPTRPEQLKE